MSYSCGLHGWAHMYKSCPACYSVSYSTDNAGGSLGASAQAVPVDTQLDRIEALLVKLVGLLEAK